jgi:hypothetical protein
VQFPFCASRDGFLVSGVDCAIDTCDGPRSIQQHHPIMQHRWWFLGCGCLAILVLALVTLGPAVSERVENAEVVTLRPFDPLP